MGKPFYLKGCCHQRGKAFQMEGGDPPGVIINHLGSKTFQIVIGGRGQGKEGREKIKRPLMGVIYLYNSTCRMEVPGSKVTGFLFINWALETKVSRWQKRPKGLSWLSLSSIRPQRSKGHYLFPQDQGRAGAGQTAKWSDMNPLTVLCCNL